MPTYAYACRNCGHRFDTVQSFSEPSLTECPECAGELRKEYGSIGVTFNGSGFYRTDSRAGTPQGKDSSTSSAAKESGSSASTPSTSSTSSKSEAKSSPAPSGS